MSVSPNSGLVQRTIDLKYANKQRAISLKWSVINGVLFVLFTYDLCSGCWQQAGWLVYVEVCCALWAGAALARHAARLAPRRAPALLLTPTQRRLLGLDHTHLDSSFKLVGPSAAPSSSPDCSIDAYETLSLSLSRSAEERSWRSADEPPSPPTRRRPSGDFVSHHSEHLGTEEFISDHRSLDDYLKQHEERRRLRAAAAPGPGAAAGPGPGAGGGGPRRAHHYQLAAVDTADSGKPEESSPLRAPQVWWRAQLDPRRLATWTYNLRLWIHMTIVERLVRELSGVEEALAALGAGEARLRAAAGSPAAGALAALLPYLEPWPDQRYVVRRVRELARGGCLRDYRWDGGGRDWHEGQPTDAELVLHLFSTYVQGQAPLGEPARLPVERAPPAHPAQRPPHYLLALGGATLDPGRGRNNLLHTLLLLLAADPPPPALRRLSLGPAGLNMLWIIGR